MTDDSDMDVRLGMEGSASLAAESTWPPWEVRGQGWHWGSKDPAGLGGPHCLARGYMCGHTGGYGHPTPASSSGPSCHPAPTTCPNLVNEADSIADVQLVVNIPDLVPQPVGRFPHQELAQVLLVELLPPAMM